MSSFSLGHLLLKNGLEVPNEIAFVELVTTAPCLQMLDNDDSLEQDSFSIFQATWREVSSWVVEMASQLEQRHVQAGDVVASWLPNSRGSIALDAACDLLGAVYVPIDPRHPTTVVEYLLKQSQAKFFVPSNAMGAEQPHQTRDAGLVTLQLDISSPDRVDNEIASTHRDRLLSCWPSQSNKERGATEEELRGWLQHEPSMEEISAILYTSGSTGKPKGVVLSHSNVISNARGKLVAMPQYTSDLRLNFLPMSHAYARTCEYATWILSRSRLAIAKNIDQVLKDAPRLGPTLINAVPYFYQRLVRIARSEEVQQPPAIVEKIRSLLGGRIRILASGGAPLAEPLERIFMEGGLPLLQGYGMTETSPVVCSNIVGRERMGSVGFPISDVRVRIDEANEVWVTGPNLMREYFNDALATADRIRDGWLRTGDLGRLNEDGSLTIVGRRSDTIVLSTGRKVEPLEVECHLLTSDWIEQAVVIGESLPGLVAILTLSARGKQHRSENAHVGARFFEEALLQELKRYLGSLPSYSHPKAFLILDEPMSVGNGLATMKGSPCRLAIQNRFGEEAAALLAT